MSPFFPIRRAPLQTQLQFLLFLVAGPVVLLGGFALFREHSIIYSNFQEKASGMVDLMAYNMAPGVEFEDVKALSEVMNGVTRGREIAYVLVNDQNGKTLCSFHPKEVQLDLWGGRPVKENLEFLSQDQTLHFRQVLTFREQVLGTLFIGFSLEGINKALFMNQLIVLGTVIFSLLIIIFAARRFGKMISEPIGKLKNAAENLSRNDYSVSVSSISAAQEIEFLGETFNQMARAIDLNQTELKNLNATLEQKVRERTRELEIQTFKAQQADRLKSEFLANMSHELRTPLTSILAWPQLILSHYEMKDTVLLGAQQIHKTATHLLRLINDLLDMEAIETGKMRVELSLMDPQPVVGEVVQHLSGYAQGREIRIKSSIMEDLAHIQADPVRLRQVLINLLSNAIKFSKVGQEVEVRLERVEGNIVFSVIDQGIGISEADLLNIFERFRQIDGSIRRRFGGSGIGLYLAKLFVSMMDGEILVSSKPDQGSCFRVLFPIPGFNKTNKTQ